MRILLAEDDYASRKFMAAFMEEFGECDHAVDGMEAVEAFEMAIEDNEPYDLICLDVMMPLMDGYQVLKAVRTIETQRGIQDSDRVKIVMMTALDQEQNINKAFELGCTAYCAKPLDLGKVKDMLKKLELL